MARPTIKDLAQAANVSIATVNRVLGDSGSVRSATKQQVLEAARQIGFYAVGALEQRVAASRPRHQLGVIIQTPHRPFSELLEQCLETAVRETDECEVSLQLEHLDDLSPEQVATRMEALAQSCDALAVLAAEHPLVSDAIDRIALLGVPVVTLVTPLSARTQVGYVGLDSWKVGRTAAWAFAHLCKLPGKVGILVGTHRYRCHDMRESGFRSYFREHPGDFTMLEPLATFESDAIARELTEKLLRDHPDLRGLYVSGGGITGALAAIRASGQSGKLVTVGHDLMGTTKAGLLDRSLTMVISHPFEAIARETVAATIRAKKAWPNGGSQSVLVPFDICTSENI